MDRSRTALGAFFIAAAVLSMVLAVRAGPGTAREMASSDAPLPEGRSAAWYARATEVAMAAGEVDRALEAARRETDAAPLSHRGWHRRAHAAAYRAGSPDREALKSLLTAYELAPYPAPADMAWRVEFAARHWSAMPDILQGHTLSQIEALAGVPDTWERRKEWCKTFPEGALAETACATVPGTWRNGVRMGAPPE